MSIIKFKVASKPELSQEEYNAHADSQKGGKFLPPGTFDLAIMSIAVADAPDSDDDAWITLTIEFQDSEGCSTRYFLSVPTECRNSYLYGNKKSAYQYEKLAAFTRGLGIVLDYDNAMVQVAQIFAKVESLIGKVIKVRMAHKGCYLKYLGKNTAGVNQYQIVDKDGKAKLEDIFPDANAAKKVALDNKIKLTFCNIVEIFSAKTPALALAGAPASSAESDLPF